MRFGQGDGAKTTVWTRGSQTILNFVHAAKRRRRMLAIAAVVATVVAGVVAFVVLRYFSAQAATNVVASYGALSQCLIGEPLKEGEKASVRYRAMQLTALGGAELARAKGDPQWPERCAPHAHALHDWLAKTDLGDGVGKPLVASSLALAQALEKKGSYHADVSLVVDKAFEDAKAANVALAPATGIPAPPKPTQALNVNTIGDTSRLAKEQLELGALAVESSRSGAVRWLATAESRKAQPVSCTFRADSAQCAAFPKPIADAAATGLTLHGTADPNGAALVFAKGGEEGIFRSDTGAPFESAKAIGGYTTVEGNTFVLKLDDDRLELLRNDGDKVRSSRVSPGLRRDVLHPARDVQLLWDHILFATEDEEQYSLAAAVIDADKGMGDVEDVGPLDKEAKKESEAAKAPRIDGCRSAQAIVARIRMSRLSYLSFRLGNKWTKPIKAGPAGGELSCHKTEAVITQVASQGGTPITSTITQHVCSPTACQTRTTVMADVLTGEAGLAPPSDLHAAGLAGKVLLVWQAGQRGGVRMRLATPPNLAKTPDKVLFDGFVKDGAVAAQSSVLTLRILPAEDFAIVLINTTEGVFAIRVGADGQAVPAKLSG